MPCRQLPLSFNANLHLGDRLLNSWHIYCIYFAFKILLNNLLHFIQFLFNFLQINILRTFLVKSSHFWEYYIYFNNTHYDSTHTIGRFFFPTKCVTFSLSSVGRKLTWVLYDRVPFVCREPPKEIPFLKLRPISPVCIIYTQTSEKPAAIHSK